MTSSEMRQRILERPFEPIRVSLKDGRVFDIRDPTWNLVGESILLIGVAPEDDAASRLPERHERIQYQQIFSVEPLTAPFDRN